MASARTFGNDSEWEGITKQSNTFIQTRLHSQAKKQKLILKPRNYDNTKIFIICITIINISNKKISLQIPHPRLEQRSFVLYPISEIDKNGINPERHHYCSTSLSQMAQEIIENKELWDEFRHELQKRKVVTSLATKEVLYKFSKVRMKRIEEQTSSMDTNVYDNAFNSNMHNFMEKHSKVRHKLHNSKIFDK